jgi:hypothetical protein
MKTELILILIVVMCTSLSAYAQDAAQDLNENVSAQGYQEGICTASQRKI